LEEKRPRREDAAVEHQWAIEELNLGPHAYQALRNGHELTSTVHFARVARTSCSVFAQFRDIHARSADILSARMDTTDTTISAELHLTRPATPGPDRSSERAALDNMDSQLSKAVMDYRPHHSRCSPPFRLVDARFRELAIVLDERFASAYGP
jgi:hypothetical protein